MLSSSRSWSGFCVLADAVGSAGCPPVLFGWIVTSIVRSPFGKSPVGDVAPGEYAALLGLPGVDCPGEEIVITGWRGCDLSR